MEDITTLRVLKSTLKEISEVKALMVSLGVVGVKSRDGVIRELVRFYLLHNEVDVVVPDPDEVY